MKLPRLQNKYSYNNLKCVSLRCIITIMKVTKSKSKSEIPTKGSNPSQRKCYVLCVTWTAVYHLLSYICSMHIPEVCKRTK